VHSLLARQLRRFGVQDPPPTIGPFLEAVSSAYGEFDTDRGMLERALDLSSQELLQANAEMREAHLLLEERVAERTRELSRANQELTKEIADRQRSEAQLFHLASHDPLTDLFNRRRFEEELERELLSAEAEASQGAVLLLDLDQFKDVNDTLGHPAGDELLKGISDLLRSTVRERDILARQGGDEFVVLMPETHPAKARQLAQEIEANIRRQVFLLERRAISITASFGLAMFPAHGASAQEVLSSADLAMYQAKANGRSRIEIFRTGRDWRSVSEGRLHWRNLVRAALRANAFVLFAQPIRNLQADLAPDYELLLRLPKPDGQLARPAEFMDIAEEFGLIREIDRWVVENAILLIKKQESVGSVSRFSVNLSGRSLGDAELLTLLQTQITSSGINPARLIPEVTETATIANLGQAQKFIRTLKSLGCQFALDDFGVGFSSFNHLKRLPVDFLKIDGSFIKSLPKSEVDQHLVQAIVAVARGLGKETIAEFVGDEETVALLRSYGVDYAQGYFLGRPREAERVLNEYNLSRVA